MPVIGIDASRANRALRTGVERYSLEIIVEIARQAPRDWRLRLYLDSEPREDLLAIRERHSNVQFKILKWPPKFLWTQIRLAWELFRNPPDVLFVPGHVFPLIHSKPCVTMIHDVAFLTHPEAYSKKGNIYLRMTTMFALQNAQKLLVPTNAVKEDLIEQYSEIIKNLSERIRVIPHGVKQITSLPDMELAKVRAKYGVRQPYIVMLGRIEKKKNTGRALTAIEEVRKTHPDLTAVLVGRPGRWYAQEMDKWKDTSWIQELGSLSDRDAFALLEGASLLLFPSRAEGFGLPILEAFSLGVPVVTSRGGATEEVAGGFATLVESRTMDEMVKGILSTLGQTRNSENSERLKQHSAKFTWERAGKETVAVLQELCKNDLV